MQAFVFLSWHSVWMYALKAQKYLSVQETHMAQVEQTQFSMTMTKSFTNKTIECYGTLLILSIHTKSNMWVFDTAYKKDTTNWKFGVQFKVWDTSCKSFEVWDKMDHILDGIYFWNEGSFVVYQWVLVAVFLELNQDTTSFVFDKWGEPIQVSIR